MLNETEFEFYKEQLGGFEGLLALTYGGEGAAIFQNGEKLCEARPPVVDVVDTTGAGDTFTGALTVALSEGQSHAEALEFACAAGALAVTGLGAQSAMPTRAELDSHLGRT